MRTTLFAAVLILVISTALSGQEKKQGTFRFTDISVSTGFETYFDRSVSDNFLLDQVFTSMLIPANLDDYQGEAYQYSSGSGTFEIMAGFAWRGSGEDGNRVNKRLRFGLSYSQPGIMSSSYYLYQEYPFDTLVSRRTGDEFQIDSTFNSNLNINYDVSRVALNTAFLWTTNDDARVSFYGGVNLSVALSFSSKINVYRNDMSYLSYEDGASISYFIDETRFLENGNESFSQSSSIGFGFSSPIGVDWRVGRQGKSLNEVHLFAEVKPRVSFNSIPNYELVSQFRSSWHLGLRFSI